MKLGMIAFGQGTLTFSMITFFLRSIFRNVAIIYRTDELSLKMTNLTSKTPCMNLKPLTSTTREKIRHSDTFKVICLLLNNLKTRVSNLQTR